MVGPLVCFLPGVILVLFIILIIFIMLDVTCYMMNEDSYDDVYNEMMIMMMK